MLNLLTVNQKYVIINLPNEREVSIIKRADVFASIKDANKLVDEMANLVEGSKEYNELSDALYMVLDVLTMGYHPWYTIHLSKRTGHYYVRFAD